MRFDDFDVFDAAVSEALQGSEQPSGGFTERVMAQVSRTPQKKRLPIKTLAALAACCVAVLLAMPFLTLRMGIAAKSADAAMSIEAPAAAPAEAGRMLLQNGAAEEAYTLTGADEDDMRRQEQEKSAAPAEQSAPAEPAAPVEGKVFHETKSTDETNGLTAANGEPLPVVTIDDAQKRAAVTALLEGRGCRIEGGYTLTAEDVAAVCAAVEGIDLPPDGCFLADAKA